MGKNGGLRPAVFFGVAAVTASGHNESMNTRNILFVSTLALAVVAMPGLAQQVESAAVTPPVTAAGAVVAAPPTMTSAAPAAPAAESEVVCRMVKVTGTRLRKERVCTSNVTREQSAEWLRNQQDHGNNIGSNAAVNGGG
ncbi:MAG: hypothetical protein RL469_206 [Pseudomonadota bacterium]